MSSILEALKKLEADKHAQQVAVETPEPVYTADQMAQSLLGNFADPAPAGSRMSPLLLVVGGGLFTLLIVGLSVTLAVLLLRPAPGPQGAAATETTAAVSPPPAPTITEAPEAEPAQPAPASAAEQPAATVKTPVTVRVAEAQSERPVRESRVERPAPERPAPERPAPERPAPAPAISASESPAVEGEPVRYEPYIPQPAAEESRSVPLPADIRKLPMLSREERSQYRLDNIDMNMLNEASPTRPLGNALINLEKVFIGETLPGTNAMLVDVKSHGIAVEILSTRQRYYLPRK